MVHNITNHPDVPAVITCDISVDGTLCIVHMYHMSYTHLMRNILEGVLTCKPVGSQMTFGAHGLST